MYPFCPLPKFCLVLLHFLPYYRDNILIVMLLPGFQVSINKNYNRIHNSLMSCLMSSLSYSIWGLVTTTTIGTLESSRPAGIWCKQKLNCDELIKGSNLKILPNAKLNKNLDQVARSRWRSASRLVAPQSGFGGEGCRVVCDPHHIYTDILHVILVVVEADNVRYPREDAHQRNVPGSGANRLLEWILCIAMEIDTIYGIRQATWHRSHTPPLRRHLPGACSTRWRDLHHEIRSLCRHGGTPYVVIESIESY